MPQRYRKIKINGRTRQLSRHMMEEHLGRPLRRDELVHHKNHDKLDDRLDNFEITSAKDHSQHHNQKHPLTKICAECGAVFTPAPTKRARAVTCSRACFLVRLSRNTAEQMRGQVSALRLTRTQAENAQARAAGGETLRALAKHFGVHVDTIRSAIAEDDAARARRRP